MATDKPLTIRLLPKADYDMEKIWKHTAANWSVDQANNYVAALTSTFDLLALSPLMARERREFVPPVRIHPHQSHVIIYRLSDGYLDIVRVVHKKQNWAPLLGE